MRKVIDVLLSFKDRYSFYPKVFIFVIFIFFLVGGVFAWQYFMGGEEAKEIGEQKVASDADISNWQTYRNEEFGFEIKYPQGFSIVPSSRETISPDSESVPSLAMYFAANEWLGQQLNYPTIGITVSRTNLSAKQWIEENFLVGVEPGQYEPYHGRSKEITETTIGNYPALQFDYFFASGHSQHTVFWNKDTIVSLSNNVTGLGDYEEVYNQMFSTFKFL